MKDFEAHIFPGKHHQISPNMRSCPKLRKVLDNILESVGASLRAPLCKLAAELDVRSHLIRTQEVRLSAPILDLSLYVNFFTSLPAQTGFRISCGIRMMMHCA